MKKIIFITIGVIVLAVAAFVGYNAMFPASPHLTMSYSDKGLDIKVSYSRPYKKGRLIFGEAKDKALQPFGKYWRLGANAATEITFNKNVNFGGKSVNAGTYRMYAVPGPTSFQVSLNSEKDVLLAAGEPNYDLDVVKVDVPVTAPTDAVEQFTITFGSDSAAVNMICVWDRTQFMVPISVQ